MASNASTSDAASVADRELVFTRVFDAPREFVYEAWTDPKHVAQWWGPNGFTTRISEMDVRPGGIWKLVMHGPDGRHYNNRIVFLEVVRPERLVFKHEPEKGDEPVGHQSTVTFTELHGKTEVTMQLLFSSAAARASVVEKYGAVEGGKQTLARLAEHLPRMAAGATAGPEEFVTTRVFDAPRDLVFKAWTETSRLTRWWGPRGFTNPVCELDPRPGGMIRIHMRAPDGAVYPMSGVVREIAWPERLVFTSAALDAEGKPIFEVLNTVIFQEEGGRTRLTLHAKAISKTPGAEKFLAGMKQGWSQSLDRLAEEVAR